MHNKQTQLLFLWMLMLSLSTNAQTFLTLDSCRSLAMAHNKNLLIAQEQVNAAQAERKAAFTNYLPTLSVTGGYVRSQKEVSLLNNEQKSFLNGMGTLAGNSLNQAAQALATQYPDLVPLIQSLGSAMVDPLNQAGHALTDALRTDTRNMYVGVLTLTQPLFMGGKIRAYDQITRYAEQLATQQQRGAEQEVILSVDQAYWQIVSLEHKWQLATAYRDLLARLQSDVDKMIAEGVATRADGLTVRVKLNEAEMTLLKVDDGRHLARMLLCQLCGLSLTEDLVLADQVTADSLVSMDSTRTPIDMGQVFEARPEVQSLHLAMNMYQKKVDVARADYFPTLALVGNYLVSNPSVFNGFEQKFRGSWNVGILLQAHLWDWGGRRHKVRAARSEANIARYRLEDAREKVELQVRQAAYQVDEAAKKWQLAVSNRDKAAENLHYADVGFREGVMSVTNVMEAQTAWLQARSALIDAWIDVQLTEVCLQKALGHTLR
ncbi:MAG: TolC family protein [Prevotellaceae bacterium]|nr:TolC family protein [Prevotellaceae bacterium]